MRISDWSSDVCSSDLGLLLLSTEKAPNGGGSGVLPACWPMSAGAPTRNSARNGGLRLRCTVIGPALMWRGGQCWGRRFTPLWTSEAVVGGESGVRTVGVRWSEEVLKKNKNEQD